jgi:hypothetical protein
LEGGPKRTLENLSEKLDRVYSVFEGVEQKAVFFQKKYRDLLSENEKLLQKVCGNLRANIWKWMQ